MAWEPYWQTEAVSLLPEATGEDEGGRHLLCALCERENEGARGPGGPKGAIKGQDVKGSDAEESHGWV